MDDQSILSTKAYKRAEANLRKKLKSSFLKEYPHYLMPGLNLNSEASVDEWDIGNTITQYQQYPYHCDFPKPLLPPVRLPRTVIEEEDPALELIALKNHMNDDIQRLKHYYERHKKELQVLQKADMKWKMDGNKMKTTIPKYLADLAEIIDMDPDPYFKGVYNWYYTGGSLKCMHFNNLNTLIFPFMGELIVAPIVSTKELCWKPLLQKSFKHKLDSVLYELEHSMVDNTIRILGRHKTYCDIYTLSEYESGYRLNKNYRQNSRIPFIGADLSHSDKNQYCTLNVERVITLWDLENKKTVNCGSVIKNTTLDDPWGSIKFEAANPSVLVFTDRCCVHYLDIRLPLRRPSTSLCLKSNLDTCENLSISIPSRHDSCRYVGTYHSVLLCDNRFPEQCIQQKWTHQFKSTPLLASSINREDEEIVVFSTQTAGENAIILNTWKAEEIPFSYSFPYYPPYIMETLNEAQMQGMCLNPYLRSRFELCNGGSIVLKNELGNVYLFLQNSIGDICYQCISHDTALNKYSPENCNAYCILDEWDKVLSAQSETIIPLMISNKSSMEHIYESFTNKKLRLKHDKKEIDYEPSWKQSLDKLNSYIDILAPELLAVWEISEEVTLPVTAAPHQKVLSWLESTTARLSQSQEEPDVAEIPVSTQESMNISQEYDITYLDDSNVLQELLLPKVKTKPTKKRRRV